MARLSGIILRELNIKEASVKHSRIILLVACMVAAALAVGVVGSQEKAPAKKAAPAKETEAAPAAQIGKKETAKWTETTVAAAGTPEQKAVLAGGKVVSVTGELVEVSCYLQLGKRGEKHIPCGSKCLQNGQPFGLLTAKNQLYLIMAEEHDPRRDGKTELREALVPLISKQVSVTGVHTMHDGYHAIYVQAFELPGGKKM